MPRNPNCELCSLHRSSKHVCVWGYGDGEGFIVGEAPGEAEARTGKPFQGQSGALLRQMLAPLNLSDAYITNVAKCRPPKNRKPEPSEIAACRPYLDEEIDARNPAAVLLLGATAMRACIGRTKITEMNGQVVEKNGRTFVCSFHPAFILRDPSKRGALEMALKRYRDVLDGKPAQAMPDWRIIDAGSLDDFLEHWHQCNAFAFDLETTGLEWWKQSINSIQFSLRVGNRTLGDVTNWALPVNFYRVMPDDAVRDLMHYLVETQGKRQAAGQNAKFDNLFLKRHYGVTFRLDTDVMLAAHLLNENEPQGLKSLARAHLGAPDFDIPLKDKKDPKRSIWRKFFGYGTADTYYTQLLAELFRSRFDEDERWLYDRLIMRSARAFTEIEFNGLYVDLDMMDEAERNERRLLAETTAKLNRIAGRTINWNAPAQVAEVLYGDLKLTPTIYTAKGAPSTAEGALVDIDHPIAKVLEEYRMHAKFLSTYIEGWREYMDGPHLYLGFKLNGTVTGRYSSRLHQVPRDGTIRNIVTAPPGWTFVQMDLSQAELRVIAIVSKDPEMLRCFGISGEETDIHWNTMTAVIESGHGEYFDDVLRTARQLKETKRKIPFDEAIQIVREAGPEASEAIWKGWKEGRKKAKGVNFGFSFGQAEPGFINYAKNTFGFDATMEEAIQFRGAFFHLYNRLPAWHERQKRLVHQDGLVRNLIGRKRHLPGIHSSDRSLVAECERQAINSPIQGFIGDYKAMILVEIHETIPHSRLRIVGEVHDSILMWVKNEHLDSTLRQAKRIGDNPSLAREAGLDFPIKLTTDIEVGRWGAGKRWRP